MTSTSSFWSSWLAARGLYSAASNVLNELRIALLELRGLSLLPQRICWYPPEPLHFVRQLELITRSLTYWLSYISVEVIAPTLSFKIITIPICILFATNMYANYYWVCTVSPGFVDDPQESQTTREGEGLIWARKRKQRLGVKWSDEPKLSPPHYNKCKRCGVQRPEVSYN